MIKDRKNKWEKGKIFSFIPTGEYYFNRGIKAYDRFDLKNAKKYLKRAFELEPYEPIIACQLAIVHTELGEYEQSNQLLLNILEHLDHQMTECHYFLANNYAHMGMFADAYKYAQLYLELDPNREFFEEAHDLLDIISLENHENLDELIEQDEMITMLEDARELLETGEFVKAEELLKKTVEVYPDLWPAYNNLALAYYYKGNTEKAFDVLRKVLEKSPGNLHALCNLAVFLYYENRTEELEDLLLALDKVQPIHFEHRYKLGATFALAGRYEQAYYWLRQVKNYGKEDDGVYYYWLAKSAFYTNRPKIAYNAWEKYRKINPSAEFEQPWTKEGEESQVESAKIEEIIKWISSEQVEERLYGIFLISTSGSSNYCKAFLDLNMSIDHLPALEKKYISYIINPDPVSLSHSYDDIARAHYIATILYQHYKATPEQAGKLLLLWFRFFLNLFLSNTPISNPQAVAAAMEYIWHRERDTKRTQKEIADTFQISVSTLRKYVLFLEEL